MPPLRAHAAQLLAAAVVGVRAPRPLLRRALRRGALRRSRAVVALGPRTGVVLTVDAATDTRRGDAWSWKAGATFADHLAGDLLPALLNVSGEHVLTAEACFRRGARDRVAAYGKMDGNLLQLLVANDTGPLRQYVPRRRDGSCFALRAAHDLLRGLAAAHAAGIVNQDVHAGNLLFAGAGPAMRWKISDFGRACVVGAGRCPHVAGSRALAPEAGHVRKTPASDVGAPGSCSCSCGAAAIGEIGLFASGCCG